MTAIQTTARTIDVLAALDAAIQLALDSGFDADEIIDTVGAMVYPTGATS